MTLLSSSLNFQQTVKQWEYVFLITAGMLIVGGILYTLFADATLQPWNTGGTEDAQDARELVSLKLDVEQAMLEKEREATEMAQEAVTAELADYGDCRNEDPIGAELAR